MSIYQLLNYMLILVSNHVPTKAVSWSKMQMLTYCDTYLSRIFWHYILKIFFFFFELIFYNILVAWFCTFYMILSVRNGRLFYLFYLYFCSIYTLNTIEL